VDNGDLKRAEELLAGVRRRLAKSKRKRKQNPPSPTGIEQGVTSKAKSTAVSDRVGADGDVRLAGRTRITLCPVCRGEYSVNRDGRLRAHRVTAGKGNCRGSGVKVAKTWKAGSGANSIRAVSGGLPSLGKRR
jgi:hypothetical protein